MKPGILFISHDASRTGAPTYQISVLPVVNATQQVVGMLRLHDIVRSGLA